MISVPTSHSLKHNKVILIICDGLRADTAFKEMGYLNSVVNYGQGVKGVSIVDNPSVSRTNYETLHTGVPAVVHGKTSNLVLGKSNMERNVFSEVKKNGGVTACVGSSWFYDLYGSDNYHYLKHKELNNENPNEVIMYGRFFSDDVPSSVDSNYEGLAHTFQTSDYVIYRYNPSYILIHILTTDYIGHDEGIGKNYHNEAGRIDAVLGATIPRWFDLGYDIIVTSDHGMNEHNSHGGSTCDVMKAPLYILSKKGWKPDIDGYHHIDIAPMIINRLVPNSDFDSYRKQFVDDYRKNSNCA